MSTFSKTIVIGYLGRDPEMRYTPDGTPVCTFSVAVNDKKRDITGTDRESTMWFRVKAWGPKAEACNQYLKRGAMVYAEGRLRADEYTNRDGEKRFAMEITATEVQFLSRGEDADERGSDQPASPTKSRATIAGSHHSKTRTTGKPTIEDDIPF